MFLKNFDAVALCFLLKQLLFSKKMFNIAKEENKCARVRTINKVNIVAD